MKTARTIACPAFLFMLVMSAGCIPAFHVSLQTAHIFPETDAVTLIFRAPDKPYQVVATFHGRERAQCPADLPYCSLRREARRLGANAIWITGVNRYHYPGDWVLIEGRLTRIYPYTSEQIQGKLIRYEKTEGAAGVRGP